MSAPLNTNPGHLLKLIKGCKQGDRRSQKQLYEHYYGFSMAICLRYSNNYQQAVEVVNDGFLKVFTKLHLYNIEKSFLGWLRKIMVNSSIDMYRKELKHFGLNGLDHLESASTEPSAIQEITYDEVIQQIQQLSPAYRAVFNLYVIDGYNHREIAQLLKISVGTSKSNLSRARSHLQRELNRLYKDELA